MRKIQFGSAIIAMFMLLSLLGACNTTKQGARYNDGMNSGDARPYKVQNKTNTQLNRYQDGSQIPQQSSDQRNHWMRGNHNNRNMETSQEVADQIANIKGVDRAYVLLTDRNAYVAVTLNDDSIGNNTIRGNARLGQQGLGSDMPFGGYDTDRSVNQRNHAKNGKNNNGVIGENKGNIVGGGTMRGHYDSDFEMKRIIAEKVKALKPELHNVYVSANPDFADRLKSYGSKIEDGQPFEGLMEEFNIMVDRLFPQPAGDNTGRAMRGPIGTGQT